MILDIEGLCRKLKPILGTKADELWYMWLAADLQERKELEIEIELIAEKVLKHGPLQDRVILLPPPSEENAEGTFLLGEAVYRDKKLFSVYLNKEDFIKQIGIFSITGGGKTNTGMLLALQLIKKRIPIMVIDWKRQWRSILSLAEPLDLKGIEVYTIGRDVIPFLWNPFRPPPNVDYKSWLSVIVECLEKSHLGGLGVGDFIFRIYEKLFKEEKGENFYPNFYDGMHELENIKVGGREFLWWQSTKRIMKSFCFGPSSKSFNARNPIKLEELFEKPVILELDQEMPKPLRIFFMELVLRFIHLYRLSQGESEELRHVLFLEEIHNLFQRNRYEKDKIDSLENVYREIRAFGQGLVSITQHCSLLPTHILGNAHTLIFLPQQHQEDIEAARKATFLPREEEIYFNMLKTGQGIVKIMERVNPCLVQFLYVPVKRGMITDEWLKSNMRGYFQQPSDAKSDEKGGYFHGDEKEDDFRKYPKMQESLLADIFLNPLSGVTQRYKRLGIDSKAGNLCKNEMAENNFIRQKKIIMKTGWITLFELTEKGRMALRDLGYQANEDNEGIEHKFWKLKIAEYYKAKGFGLLIEEHTNGKPDIIIISGNKKTAIEIETGESYYLKNIERDIKAFDEVVCVAVNKEVEEKIIQEFNQADDKVKIISAFSFPI
jgi:hypothetical protein